MSIGHIIIIPSGEINPEDLTPKGKEQLIGFRRKVAGKFGSLFPGKKIPIEQFDNTYFEALGIDQTELSETDKFFASLPGVPFLRLAIQRFTFPRIDARLDLDKDGNTVVEITNRD